MARCTRGLTPFPEAMDRKDMDRDVNQCNSSDAQAIKVLNMIKVYGKPIRVNKASQDKKTADVGANLFIGNIDPDVDEKVKSTLIISTFLVSTTMP